MFFVSSRVNLDNEDRVGSEETYWEISAVNQRETQRRKVTLDTLRDFVDRKHILVLVHGYNNEFEDIVRSYDIIQAKVNRHLSDFYDAVLRPAALKTISTASRKIGPLAPSSRMADANTPVFRHTIIRRLALIAYPSLALTLKPDNRLPYCERRGFILEQTGRAVQ